MTDPRPDGRNVRRTLREVAEAETAAADALDCIARRGMTMDRQEIAQRCVASQAAHLSAAARLYALVIELRKAD